MIRLSAVVHQREESMSAKPHDKPAQPAKPEKRAKSPPLRIPLDFETAVTAFSQVDPKGPVREKPAKKKRPKK
jgi:hypothetical protein